MCFILFWIVMLYVIKNQRRNYYGKTNIKSGFDRRSRERL